MRKLILPLAAAAALALPASALAWSGGDHHSRYAGFARLGVHTGNVAGLEVLSGTGTSFAGDTATATGSLTKSADHPNGHFSASLATTWASATTKSFAGGTFKCAPATASVTLSNGTSATTSYTGKTCSTTRNGTTKYVFAGTASNGLHAFLGEDGSTVKGAITAMAMPMHFGVLGAAHTGSCDHNH
jgi:hypothetical protein